jgi:uncharacterized surface protein with fasciclin (FAS1) repeats
MPKNKVLTLVAAVLMLNLPQTASASTILDVLKQDGRFTTLIDLLKRSDLDQLATGRAQFTLFAPTDEAFSRLKAEERRGLQGQSAAQALTEQIGRLLVAGQIGSGDVAAQPLRRTSVTGASVVLANAGRLTINGVAVVQPDLDADNGIVHVIEAVPATR